MIEVKNVYLKEHSEYFSLFNANFSFEKNTLLIGDETNGVYSLFRVIAKIDKNYKGEILYFGTNLKKVNNKELDLAYVCANDFLFNQKTIFYNLFYPLKIRGIKKQEAINKINSLFSRFNIKLELNAKAKTLTSSERKLLCLIRGLIREPKVLIAENLFMHLDKDLFQTASNLIANAKNTLILASEQTNEFNSFYSNFTIIDLNKN